MRIPVLGDVIQKIMPRITIEKKIKYYLWKPKEDITAYELALCMGVIVSRFSSIEDLEKDLDDLPLGAKRHIELERD